MYYSVELSERELVQLDSVDHKLLYLYERIRVSATSFDQSDGDRIQGLIASDRRLIPTN